MNDKLKRAVAIISLILILVFTVSLVLYLIDRNMLNGGIGGLAMWSGGFGLLLAAVLWISHAFPYQQINDEKRDEIYKEAERLAEEEEKKNAENSEDLGIGEDLKEAPQENEEQGAEEVEDPKD